MTTRENLLGWAEEHRDLLLEALRVYLGLGLFVKGVYFAGHLGALVSLVQGAGLDVVAVLISHYVVMAHLAGGLLLAAGLLTRLAALVQLPVLIGAVLVVHLRAGLFSAAPNLEFAVLVLVLLAAFAVAGGGRWSADHALAARERRLFSRA